MNRKSAQTLTEHEELEKSYSSLADDFEKLMGYNDSEQLKRQCKTKAEEHNKQIAAIREEREAVARQRKKRGSLILLGVFIAHSIVLYIILTDNPQLFRMPFVDAPPLIEYIMMMFGPLLVFNILVGAVGKAHYTNDNFTGYGYLMIIVTIVLYIMLDPGNLTGTDIVIEAIRIIVIGAITAVISMAIGIGIGEKFKQNLLPRIIPCFLTYDNFNV